MTISKQESKAASLATLAVLAGALAGCATPPPRPIGAVLPLDGGRYQSVVKSSDQAGAQKAMVHDAEVTCTVPDGKQRMPWEAKQLPGRYVVVSQAFKDKEGKQIKAENKNLEAGIAVGLRYAGMEAKDSVEMTTVFKCQ